MIVAKPREDEAASLAALHALRVLDTAPEAVFDALVRAAAAVCGTSMSLLTLIDADRQWFKARVGLEGADETSRDVAFCAHAVLHHELFEVNDALADARFADNPFVRDDPSIRFYAGMPIRVDGGHLVGTLCVVDRTPRALTDAQRDTLRSLAGAAEQALDWRRAMLALKDDHAALEAERRRRELNEDFLRRTGQLAGVGGWQVDLRTREIYWSDETCRLHGVAPGYVPNLDEAYSFYAPEARATIAAAVDRGMRTGEPWDLELPFVQADGTPIFVRAVGSAEFADGAPVRLVGAFQDVTERRRQQRALEEVSELNAALIESIGDGVLAVDTDRRFVAANAAARRMLGPAVDIGRSFPLDWAKRNVATRPDGGELATDDSALGRALRGLDTDNLIATVNTVGGRPALIEVTGRAIRRADGSVAGGVAVFRDVTEARRVAAALAQSEQVYREIVKHLPNGAVMMIDRDLTYVAVDGSGVDMINAYFGVTTLVGKRVTDVVPEATREQVRGIYTSIFAGKELRLELKRGDRFYDMSAVPIYEGGAASHALIFLYDVTARKAEIEELSKARAALEEAAVRDVLTGLLNRRGLLLVGAQELKVATRARQGRALFFVDLDGMKTINDSLGHEMGDRALVETAALLQRVFRASDVVARLGGDEFVVLATNDPSEPAVRARLAAALATHNAAEGRPFKLSLSVGVQRFDPARPVELDALVAAADARMYEQKKRAKRAR